MDGTTETEVQERGDERTLIIRSNRLLGTALIESGLVDNEAVETAHEKLLMNLEAGMTESPSILTYLLFEQKALKENDLIEYTLKNHSVGLIDIRHYTLDSLPEGCELSKCFATWSIPFNYRDGVYFIATAHYLSKPVTEAWEALLDGPIFWYVTSMRSIMIALKKISAIPQRPDVSEESEAEKTAKAQEEQKPNPHDEDDDEEDTFEFSSGTDALPEESNDDEDSEDEAPVSDKAE